jgi:hypothetical protein
MSGDDAETTGELDVSIAGVAGASLTSLTAAVTIAPRGGDASELTSLVVELAHVDPIAWRALGEHREWIVGLIADGDGGPVAITADGALRIGAGAGSRRYALPTGAGGLAGVWRATDGELLVCGPGALGRVRIRPGRIWVDLVEDDGPGDALAVAGPGAIDGAIAVGTRGALWRYADDEWVAHETAARESLVDVAWHDDGCAYVAGAAGGVFAWDGRALREVARAPGRGWTAIASWRGAVYLAGDRRGVWRLAGDALVAVTELPVTRVRAIADHLFAWGGALLARYDGTAWWGGPLHIP